MAATDPFLELTAEFNLVLSRAGLHGALRFLNARTPHRFTGVYRFEDTILRNVGLFDRFNPEQLQGDDAPLGNTYCSLLPKFNGELAFAEACNDPRVSHIKTPVVSYCGVQLRAKDGAPMGTLCHFDLRPCEPRSSDMQFLEKLAPLLERDILGLPRMQACSDP